MLPKHLREVSPNRKAFAPYNFVELPDRIVKVDSKDLPNGNAYHPNLLTGRIECILTTESPLFIRCGLTAQQFANGEEAKDKSEFFYTDLNQLQPVLPGSSLRGMLRSLVEIASFGKISQVSGHQKFFFRAVAAPTGDSLGQTYKDLISVDSKKVQGVWQHYDRVSAGYLVKKPDGWYIRPAKTIPVRDSKNRAFGWVDEEVLVEAFQGLEPPFIPMSDLANYRPQQIKNIYFKEVDYDSNNSRDPRLFVSQISAQRIEKSYLGIVVTSGNMLEGSDNPDDLKRRCHCVVRAADKESAPLKISDDAIQSYRSLLTQFQQEPPFSKENGVLKSGRCIFYCKPSEGEEIRLFGHSPNFRIPYSPNHNGVAASASDFVPLDLRDPNVIDIAEAIFGFVRQENQNSSTKQAQAGRVFISDGKCLAKKGEEIWLSDEVTTIQLLEPKPTTFQHYLVQTSDSRSQLKHYMNQPIRETVIRGHKLYWHQGANPTIAPPQNIEPTTETSSQIRPIRREVSFKFIIHFENLHKYELGALLWVLHIAQNPSYRLSLGMGKPLGMGAVKITSTLHFCDRVARYSKLFEKEHFALNDSIAESTDDYIQAFKQVVTSTLNSLTDFETLPRINMLLTMLKWKPNLSVEEKRRRRYMTIEPNQYTERSVLPTPLDVDPQNL